LQTQSGSDFKIYLQPTPFIDSAAPAVAEFAQSVCNTRVSEKDRAVALYLAVRDGIRYDPYRIDLTPSALSASAVLKRQYGFCVPKAILLAAAARAVEIPSRLGFADVRNHLSTERLRQRLKSDVFVFHGYTELFLGGKWVKATPAFNRSLCERFDVKPLEFDGCSDSVFQEYTRSGERHMEYLRDHGDFADLPYAQMVSAFKQHYPNAFAGTEMKLAGRFDEDATTDKA